MSAKLSFQKATMIKKEEFKMREKAYIMTSLVVGLTFCMRKLTTVCGRSSGKSTLCAICANIMREI